MSLAGFRVDCSVLVGACGVTFLINGISLSGRDSLTFVNLNARVAALHETRESCAREQAPAATATRDGVCTQTDVGGRLHFSATTAVCSGRSVAPTGALKCLACAVFLHRLSSEYTFRVLFIHKGMEQWTIRTGPAAGRLHRAADARTDAGTSECKMKQLSFFALWP